MRSTRRSFLAVAASSAFGVEEDILQPLFPQFFKVSLK